jgi:nucleoside-diphosphate-sugar epimerase
VRIVVTGAAGFIGSHLAETLAALGHEVVGLDCLTDYYSRQLKELNAADIEAAGARFMNVDLATDGLDEALAGAEIVYHCAAQPGISASVPFAEYVRNNLTATQRLADAATGLEDLGCFVYVSTSSVYGRHATESEEAACRPTSFYGVTKLAAEQLVLSYARKGALDACSIRLFSVYGPRERPEKLYPKLIDCILSGQPFPLYEGSLEHSRSFTYVDDAVNGLVAVLDRLDVCGGEIFNIGSEVEITTARGIEIIEEVMGAKAEFRALPKRPGDQLHTHANITKARRLLGYEPVTRPEEGLRAEVDWYKERVFGKIHLYD